AGRISGPHRLPLARRLPPAVGRPTPPPDEPRDRPQYEQAFAIADHRRLVLFTDPRRLQGRLLDREPDQAKPLLGFFDELWERSLPDGELRRLGI
ncbi:MAG: hypothetical protein ACFCBW_21350, partial [Candidatus Competibacterales bacterium]